MTRTGDLILYTSDDGQTQVRLRVDGKTVWLSQSEVAELFLTTRNNVSIHTEHIFEEGELTPEATVKQSLTVQTEGGRAVKRSVEFYKLDLILAIGFRVRSPRGTQFRQSATTRLREFTAADSHPAAVEQSGLGGGCLCVSPNVRRVKQRLPDVK